MRRFSARASGPGAPASLYLSAVRLAALAAVLLLKDRLDARPYFGLVFAAAMSHYVVALLYSGTALKARAADPRALLKLAGLLAAGLLLWRGNWLLFGAHMALSDAHLLEEAEGRGEGSAFYARLGLNFFAYMAVAAYGYGWSSLPLWCAAAAACALWTFAALRAGGAPGAALLRTALFESSWPLLFFLVSRPQPHWDLIFYHVLMWTLVPLPDLAAQPGRAPRYLGATALGLLAFYGLIRAPGAGRALNGALIYMLFNIGGNLHIMLSLGLSRLNPARIRDAFAPARPAAAMSP